MMVSIGNEVKASVKQNASGFWYCNELTVTDQSLFDAITVKLDKAIYLIEGVLDKYNKKDEEDKVGKKS